MGRTPQPWWWEARKAYYATVHGTRHKLGTNLRDAKRELKELLTQQETQHAAAGSLKGMFDAFIDFCREHKAKRTADWYRDYTDDFLSFLRVKGEVPGEVDPETVSPRVVRMWLKERGTAQRARITALKTAYNWARAERWVTANPLQDMKRPPVKQRTEYVSPQDFFTLLLHVPDHCFFQLLVFCWDVGCRPQEAKALHNRHLDLANHRAVFPKEESKGKKRPRVIYFTERAERIVRENIRDGYVFLNARGQKWTANAVRCRFKRLEEKIGKRYCQYLIRHAWTTRKLLAGEDSHVVAELAGHSDTRMLESHYSKIRQHDGFLLEAARRKA